MEFKILLSEVDIYRYASEEELLFLIESGFFKKGITTGLLMLALLGSKLESAPGVSSDHYLNAPTKLTKSIDYTQIDTIYLDSYTKNKIQEIRQQLDSVYPNNEFSKLLSMIETSSYKYGIRIRNDNSAIENFTTRGARESKNAFGDILRIHMVPPKGLDAFIQIGDKAQYADAETKSKKVNNINLLFHELYEAYLMCEQDMVYSQAHGKAKEAEKMLINQIPNLTEFPAGGFLTKIT